MGHLVLVEDQEEKRRACDLIMRQYSGEPPSYLDEELQKIVVIRVEIDEMTGKQSGY